MMLARTARKTFALSRDVLQCRLLTAGSRANASDASQSTAPAAPEVAPRGKPHPSGKPVAKASLDVLQGLSLHAEAHTQRVVIDAFGPSSFTVSGVHVSGSLLLLPHLATYWNVDRVADVCPESFALIKLHTPRPDMVLLGTGSAVHPVSPDLYAYFRKLGVRFDVLDTRNACQTFNVLNEEGRLVAAALLPASASPPDRPNPL